MKVDARSFLICLRQWLFSAVLAVNRQRASLVYAFAHWAHGTVIIGTKRCRSGEEEKVQGPS